MGELLQVQMRRQQMGQEHAQPQPTLEEQRQNQLREAQAGLAAMQQAQMAPPAAPRSPMDMVTQGGSVAATAAGAAGELPAGALDGVSRNSPCPCGSGRKVKQCHGKIT